MITRVEVNDTRIENARSTVDAELNPPLPLKLRIFHDGKITVAYTDYEEGLFSMMESICKKSAAFVRKLEIKVELENVNAEIEYVENKN